MSKAEIIRVSGTANKKIGNLGRRSSPKRWSSKPTLPTPRLTRKGQTPHAERTENQGRGKGSGPKASEVERQHRKGQTGEGSTGVDIFREDTSAVKVAVADESFHMVQLELETACEEVRRIGSQIGFLKFTNRTGYLVQTG